MRDADRVIGLLEKEGLDMPKLIINRIRPQMVKEGDMLEIDEIVQVLAIDLLGVIPDDERVIKGSNKGEPTVMDPTPVPGSPIAMSGDAFWETLFLSCRSTKRAGGWRG